MEAAKDARFRVSGLLKVRNRPGTFVCGEIIEGSVKPGMEIAWPLHGDALTMPLLVRSVEFIDYAPRISGIALAIRFDDDEAEHEQLLRDLATTANRAGWAITESTESTARGQKQLPFGQAELVITINPYTEPKAVVVSLSPKEPDR